MAIDWQKDCADTMWAMFWMGQQNRKAKPNSEALKVQVARLIRMTTQKTSGQRGAKGDIDWNGLMPTLINIAAEATALCLSGELGEMPKEIDE